MDCFALNSFLDGGILKVNRAGSSVDKMKSIFHNLEDEEEKLNIRFPIYFEANGILENVDFFQRVRGRLSEYLKFTVFQYLKFKTFLFTNFSKNI